MIEVGVDESGTGAWAGPYVVAAVLIESQQCAYLKGLGVGDSKTLSDARRRNLVHHIAMTALAIEAEVVTVEQIDEHRGSKAAWVMAVNAVIGRCMARTKDVRLITIDGMSVRGVRVPPPTKLRFRPKADRDVVAVSAASIIAKTYRNDLMLELAAEYPEYQWDKNYGYPSVDHKQLVRERGLTPHHRLIKPNDRLDKPGDRV